MKRSLALEWSPRNEAGFESVKLGSSKKFWWICESGHEYDASPSNRSLGRGCPVCAGKRVSELNSLKVKAPDLERYWSPKNEIAFSEVGFGSCKKRLWVCESGHEWEASPKKMRRKGSGCPYCSGKKFSVLNSLKTRAPHLEKEWSPRNGIGFGDVSFGTHKKRWWVCEKGHEWEARVCNRVHGRGCPKCSGAVVSELNSLKIKAPYLEREWSPRNGIGAGDVSFASSKGKYWWVCDKGHEWEAWVFNRTLHDQGCPKCATSYTNLERTLEKLFGVQKFNKGCGPKTHKNYQYRPDIKVSNTVYVNADGLYWHSEKKKGRTYHWDIRVAFEEAGLRLLQFWEDEVLGKPEIVKSMVDAVIGKTKTRLHARKCKIIELSRLQVNEFLSKNHIIGPVHFSSCLGLEFDNELVQVLTYNKVKEGLQITRTATKLHTLVRGGLSKLLEEVKRKENPSKIITFCDLRYADGHSLTRLGFKHVHTCLEYQYAKPIQRKDKRLFRVPKGVDEEEEASKKGWWRIWNAGLAKYELVL